MIRAVSKVNLIYGGKIFKQGEIFDCDEEKYFTLEKLGKAEKISGSKDEELENLIPVDGLPTLEEEQKSKGKKK